jgi:hypothetical protein
MNAQMKLLESEYGVKLSYYNQNEDTRNMLQEESNDGDDLIKIQNTEKNKLNTKNTEQDVNTDNNEEDGNNEPIKITVNKNPRNSEEVKNGGKDSVIALNNENSSDRDINKNESIEDGNED